MHWKRLDRDSPNDGTTCVVGHFARGHNKPIMGLWKYCYFGDNSYWLTKHGEKISCGKYDNWCDVEDIIDVVGEKIEDELRSALNDIRTQNGFCN